MKAAGFLRCVSVDALKMRRTLALALAVLLPAAPVGVFFIYLVREGTAPPRGTGFSAASLVIQQLVGLWAILVLPVFAAVETSLLAAIEHQNRGWKHLFALPPARGSLIGAKFASAVLLVGIAHTCLFGYTLALLWAIPKLRPGIGFDGRIPILAALLVVAACAVSSLFVVGIHAFIALRWPSFALNVGIALAGLLCVVVVLETPARLYYPWGQPGAVLNIVVPWIFHWPGGPAGPADILAVLAISTGGFLLTAFGGGWLLSRRDVF